MWEPGTERAFLPLIRAANPVALWARGVLLVSSFFYHREHRGHRGRLLLFSHKAAEPRRRTECAPASSLPTGDHSLVSWPGSAPGHETRDLPGEGARDSPPETFAIWRVVARRLRRTWCESMCRPLRGRVLACARRIARAIGSGHPWVVGAVVSTARGLGLRHRRTACPSPDRDLRARRCIDPAHRRLTQAPPQHFSVPVLLSPRCGLGDAAARALGRRGCSPRIFLRVSLLHASIAISRGAAEA